MFPNVRLMIAALLASVVVLICGFGVFAAFHVSHEPIAHLPAAAAPLQLIAENAATPSAALVTREAVEQHSQFAVVASGSEEALAEPAAVDQHSPAEIAADPEQVAPETVAAMDAEPVAGREAEEKPSAMAEPADQAPSPPPPAGDLAAAPESGDRAADMAANVTSAAPRQPAEAAAEPSAGNSETRTNEAAAGETVAGGSTAMAERPPSATNAAPNAETEPAAAAAMPAEATPDDMADDMAERGGADAAIEPPLPRARPNVSAARPAGATAERRRIAAAASRLRHVRVVGARIAARAVRAVHFTAPYYAQTQYAQTQYAQGIDQSYGYGQSSVQAAQLSPEQIAVRRVVRLPHTRLAAARKLNPATGGPFVSAHDQ